jgi:REP element-mobilizing transposase RayT
MARKLRLLVAGGWYHVLNRGNRREPIFRTDDDRRRFLGRLAELPERFRVEIHAFVLMDNHYHLVLRTWDANLSEAVRWLQVSYSSVFNWAHRVRGHLFQGRYESALIEDVRGVAEVARYVHLNPVRLAGLGLGKPEQRRARVTGVADPGAELVRRRLAVLEDYPWSSWRVYGGQDPRPKWLSVDVIAAACGGRSRKDQRRALREYTEGPVRQGWVERPWDRLVKGGVLGSAEFASEVLQSREQDGGRAREAQTGAIQKMPRIPWSEIVKKAEKVSGRKWTQTVERHGDWMRDAVLHVAVRYLGYRLAEVYREVPGLNYAAAAQGVGRFVKQMETDKTRRDFVASLRREFAASAECRK